MSKLRDAAQQALEALEKEPADSADWIRTMKAARAALRTALAEQPAEQAPVAWWHRKSNTFTIGNLVSNFAEWTPLYTAPQPAKPVEQEPVAPQQQQLKRTTHPLDVPLEVFLADF